MSMRKLLLLCMPWISCQILAQSRDREPVAMAVAPPSSSEVSPSGQHKRLDGGLLAPAWFGPGIAWVRTKGVDYQWVRPDAHLDPPTLYLAPWELPVFLRRKDALDHALGGQVSEELQGFLRDSLCQVDGIALTADPGGSPYHAIGRVVEATQVRQGAQAALALLAGFPTATWDFKVVDARNGEVLLATHHRMVGAGHAAWLQFVTENLAGLAGQGEQAAKAWEMPTEAAPLPGGGLHWQQGAFTLGEETIHLLPWKAETDSSLALSRAWTSGMGQALASNMVQVLTPRLEGRGFHLSDASAATYLLQGRIFGTPRHVRVLYQARLLETRSRSVVARFEIPAPFSREPLPKIADQLAAGMSALRGSGFTSSPSGDGPAQSAVLAKENLPWTHCDDLVPVNHGLEAVWRSPGFTLKGRSLQVGDWYPPLIPSYSSDADRAFAEVTTRHAPGWLLGALAPHSGRGLTVSRTEGELRLEGRVVEIDEADLSHFGQAMAAELTFGLASRSRQVFQIRIVEQATNETLLLVQQRVTSFKVASSGTSYKAMKWMAQEFVPWLVNSGP